MRAEAPGIACTLPEVIAAGARQDGETAMDRQSTEIELTPADAPAAPSTRSGPLRFVTRPFLWPLRKFFDRRFTAVQDSLAAHISAEARDTRLHLSALTNDQHLIELREESARIDDLRRY